MPGHTHALFSLPFLGTGVGGGIILDSRIISGSHGAGGEIGHAAVQHDETEKCNCGNRGCLEQYASATGIVRVAKRVMEATDEESVLRGFSRLSAKNVLDAYKEGDKLAAKVMDEVGEKLGSALAVFACVVDPEAIVIGGGITKGVTNVELCAAYASIANSGNYIKPIYYTKILDHNGNVLIENTSVERSVIKESTAYLLTSAMEDVVKYGTGTACQLDNMAVAGKTGTTEAYNDVWFVGYTPYYTCAIWSGYDNNEKLPDYARKYHRNLWKKVMTRIHEGLPQKDFEKPASVEKLSICAISGLLPRAGCPVTTEYFDVGTMPTEYCEEHFYDESSYDYDTSDQTDSSSTDTSDAENTDTSDAENTDTSDDSTDGTENTDGTDGDNTGDYDNTGDTDDGGDDSQYQIDY